MGAGSGSCSRFGRGFGGGGVGHGSVGADSAEVLAPEFDATKNAVAAVPISA